MDVNQSKKFMFMCLFSPGGKGLVYVLCLSPVLLILCVLDALCDGVCRVLSLGMNHSHTLVELAAVAMQLHELCDIELGLLHDLHLAKALPLHDIWAIWKGDF